MASAKKAATKTAARKTAAPPAAQPAATPEWAAAPAVPEWTPAPEPAAFQPAPSGFNERQYAMFLHLSALATIIGIPSFLGPLVLWLIKKDESPFVDRHGRAALNFQISAFLYVVALVVVIIVLFLTIIGILLAIPLMVVAAIGGGIAFIVLPIVAGLKANDGREYRYPLAIEFLKEPLPRQPQQ